MTPVEKSKYVSFYQLICCNLGAFTIVPGDKGIFFSSKNLAEQQQLIDILRNSSTGSHYEVFEIEWPLQ